MTAIAIALGALLIAALEVAALVVILFVLAAVAYGVAVGCRRSRPTSTTRLGGVGVPRQLGERRHGSRVATFDDKPIGERLDHDIEPGCER